MGLFAAVHESVHMQVFDDLTPRHGGRRPKSATARNRGMWTAVGGGTPCPCTESPLWQRAGKPGPPLPRQLSL